MFYVFEPSSPTASPAISFPPRMGEPRLADDDDMIEADAYRQVDIDFVDDALLNIAPHNPIERQLLTGDMVGLALMSGAIIWSAMGAFG